MPGSARRCLGPGSPGVAEPSGSSRSSQVTGDGSEAWVGQSLAVSTRCKERPTPRYPNVSRFCQMCSAGSGSQVPPLPRPVLGPADVARQKDAGVRLREAPAASQLRRTPLPAPAPSTVPQRAGTLINLLKKRIENPTFPNWTPQGYHTPAKGRDLLKPGSHHL